MQSDPAVHSWAGWGHSCGRADRGAGQAGAAGVAGVAGAGATGAAGAMGTTGVTTFGASTPVVGDEVSD
jgi:hypothetical protein